MTTTRPRKLASFLLVAFRARAEMAKRIRSLRLERHWTQAFLGSKVGVEAQTISRWERGGHMAKPENLDRLAAAFDMDVGKFMAGIREPKAEPSMPLRISQDIEEIKAQLAEIQRALEANGRLGLPGADDDPAEGSDPPDTEETQPGRANQRAGGAGRN